MKQYFKYLPIVLIGVLMSACNSSEKTNPTRKNIEEAIFGSGFIEQDNEYIISSTVNGVIDSLPVKEGESVGIGNLIAILKSELQNTQLQDAYALYNDAQKNTTSNSPQLLQLQAQITQAREQLNLDKTNYDRYKDLRSKNSVSQLDLDRAELQYTTSNENLIILDKRYKETKDALQLNADRSRIQVDAQKALLNDYRLTADQTGEVINVYKKKGELVRPGEAIAKIGSGAYLIKLYVSEDDISKVNVGQHVVVHLNTYPNRTFDAKVSKILPGFDEKEQSYVVEAVFDKMPPKMFSGTQLQANIAVDKRTDALIIPTSYLLKGRYVMMDDGSRREVVIGNRNSEWTEIISGLTENDVIIKK